jgi:hypothetical protein
MPKHASLAALQPLARRPLDDDRQSSQTARVIRAKQNPDDRGARGPSTRAHTQPPAAIHPRTPHGDLAMREVWLTSEV